MKNNKRIVPTPLPAMILTVGISVGLGVALYYLEQDYTAIENVVLFYEMMGVLSILIPLTIGLYGARKRKTKTDILKSVAKNFFLSLICTSIGLILILMTYFYLDEALGTAVRSEFSGLELVILLEWFPIMFGISALLTLIGTGICMIFKRKK